VRIATWNVNSVTARLPRLVDWLGTVEPDVLCLQEIKTSDATFPSDAVGALGYEVATHGTGRWNGVALLSRCGEIHETRRGLPGDPDDTHSRYIEAAINGLLIGGLYLPNGNPRPGPKFDYKMRWFERLIEHAAGLLDSGLPVILIFLEPLYSLGLYLRSGEFGPSPYCLTSIA